MIYLGIFRGSVAFRAETLADARLKARDYPGCRIEAINIAS